MTRARPKETATPDGWPGASGDDRLGVREVATSELTAHDITAIRRILWDAFGAGDEGMTEDDWTHALGGTHFILDIDGDVVCHASVVEREIHVDGTPLRTGYVEAVATAPDRQGLGHGTRVMRAATAYIRERFELGVLGTGRRRFYERLGWLVWAGPASVRTGTGTLRTPDENGFILVLPTPSSPPLDPTAPISCDWRPGDVW